MNILMMGNAYPPTYMGGESIQIRNLAVGLKKKGHRLFVVHPVPSPDGRFMINLSRPEEDIEVYRILLPEGKGYLDHLNTAALDTCDHLLDRGERIDLIHCHSNRFSPCLEEIVQKKGLPLVTTIHSIDVALVRDIAQSKKSPADPREMARYKEDVERSLGLCAASDRIIAVSSAMESHISRFFKAPRDRIRVVFNGIDLRALTEPPRQNALESIRSRLSLHGRTVILFTGRIEPFKGIRPLSEACRALSRGQCGASFLFLGNGSADRWLREYLAGCADVHFIDWLPFTDLVDYYHLADILVLPSLIESFGLAALEAMACRTCVITSNADGLDEMITHHVDGIKIPMIIDDDGDRRIDPKAVHRALDKVLREPEWRETLAEQAVKRAGEFSLERMVEGVECVYRECFS